MLSAVADAAVRVLAQAAPPSIAVFPRAGTGAAGLQKVNFAGTVRVTPPPPAPQNSSGIGSGVQVYVNGAPTVPPTFTTDASGDFSYTATEVQPGTYTFSVQQSPLGLYSAASASTDVTAMAAPTTLSVKPSPAVITFGSPSVVLSGTVTALPAGNASAVPVPNAPVYLNGSASPVATTDANGHFSYTATAQDTTDTFSVSAANSAGLYTDASDSVPVNVDPGTTAMAVTANPPDINLATSKVTFTGTVSVTPLGSATAEGAGSGIPVYLSVGGGAASQRTTTNDANDDFSYTATGVKKAADYDFSVNSGMLWTAGSKSVPIGQNQVQSTLTVTPTPASVTEGSQTVMFAGQLTGVSPSGGAT